MTSSQGGVSSRPARPAPRRLSSQHSHVINANSGDLHTPPCRELCMRCLVRPSIPHFQPAAYTSPTPRHRQWSRHRPPPSCPACYPIPRRCDSTRVTSIPLRRRSLWWCTRCLSHVPCPLCTTPAHRLHSQYARTLRLPQRLVALGVALGGAAGVHLSYGWGLVVSQNTLLRLLRCSPRPPSSVWRLRAAEAPDLWDGADRSGALAVRTTA
jgi:hypothetical protein